MSLDYAPIVACEPSCAVTEAKPLMIELFAGLHGWGEGALAEGFRVVGFDIVDMVREIGAPRPDGDLQLVLQDVLTLHGAQFKDAALIVASPPCQAYSYRAMPWKRAKALPPPDNSLFEACFRIQREACEAAGRHIPLVVENVKGAQKWVGRARWHFGSFYLWGDVPALMPIPKGRGELFKNPGQRLDINHPAKFNRTGVDGTKNSGGSWFAIGSPGQLVTGQNPDGRLEGVKGFTPNGERLGKNVLGRKHGSKSKARKAASAQIAKIPEVLARHIARAWHP